MGGENGRIQMQEERFYADAMLDDSKVSLAGGVETTTPVFCSVKVSTRSLGWLDLYLGLPESLRYQVNDVIFDLQGSGDP